MGERCEMRTRKGTPCPIRGDRERNGHWVCHVHDPLGVAAEHRKQKRVVRERWHDLKREKAQMHEQFKATCHVSTKGGRHG